MTPRLSENERQADLMGRGTYRKVGRQEGHPDGGEIGRKGGGVSVGAAGGEVDPSWLGAKVAPQIHFLTLKTNSDCQLDKSSWGFAPALAWLAVPPHFQQSPHVDVRDNNI